MINHQTVSQLKTLSTDFINSFLSSPSTIISVVSMLLTIMLFIINVYVIRRNAKIEFERKINLDYYEITVITAMKDLFRIISSIKSEYYQLKNNYNPQRNETSLKKNCEKYLNKIDEYIESIEHSSCVLIQVYSESSSKNLQKVIEDFDDSCTNIVSKYSRKLKARKTDLYTEAFNTAISKIIKDVYTICKELTP
nr:hypothetical protein [uncultured Treponema sp.]